ncbi:unnamed protein product [Phytophthora lilii]|uniref:Unnamed protein product n=1 Tax=Phytophthora lilii TaxID=2077276 RepID=A0A9W6UC71_9STRA|nr:unnamed protein product [Phytophthora lilii]
MAPKISSVLGFHEREQLHKNPSILAYTGDVGQNYLDLGEGYGDQENEQGAPAPRDHRHTNRGKKKANSSRLTSLSSSIQSARTAVNSRAKKLHVRESTRQAINHLRKSVKGASSRSSRSQSKESFPPAAHQTNQFDNDRYGDTVNQAGVENGYECMYAEVSLGGEIEFGQSSRGSTAGRSRLPRLLPPRPWIKKQKRRFSEEELY